jgi:hypothetical protein
LQITPQSIVIVKTVTRRDLLNLGYKQKQRGRKRQDKERKKAIKQGKEKRTK